MVVQDLDKLEAYVNANAEQPSIKRPRVQVLTQRQALLAVALLLVIIKSLQFALDSQLVFFFDSGSYILNALRLAFIPDRSYVYGELIRVFALPFHSLRAIVAMQIVMGGCSAWLLAFALVRYFAVRPWIAILAALAFSFDPSQIMHEHMVMAETTALLAMAIYLVTVLEYIRAKSLHWLVIVAFLGTVLASLRVVYVPMVLAAALLVPLVAWVSLRGTRFRPLALALIVSCVSTFLFHTGYRDLTGHLAHREPAYTYTSGGFLLGSVSPIVEPSDSPDTRIADAIVAQGKSRFPLLREFRVYQLWQPDGLIIRINTIFGENKRAADKAERDLAVAAIRRNPLGYFELAVQTSLDYVKDLRHVPYKLIVENGMQPPHQVHDDDARAIQSAFGADVSNQDKLYTPSRRYHMAAANWHIFLLFSPILGWFAFRLNSANRKGAGLLFLWSALLLGATWFGATETVYRYLHPFSFTGLAAAAILCETMVGRMRAVRINLDW